MTDRELLELAAKATGIELYISVSRYTKTTKYFSRKGGFQNPWNPLEYDGDALRLAVKLGLLVHGSDSPSTVWCQVGECPDAFLEAAKPDPYAATRRAITRAAAEIGRSDK
jgi:hypothetical protein